MHALLEFFERLISDFSWRRLLFIVTTLGILIMILWVYESYTANFTLTRIEKEIALVERLADLSERPITREDSVISQLRSALETELGESIFRTKKDPIRLSRPFKQGLAAAFTWFLLALLMTLVDRRDPNSTGMGVAALGLAVMATPFVVLGIFLPSFDAAWINYVLYPLGNVILVVVAVVLYQRRRNGQVPQDQPES